MRRLGALLLLLMALVPAAWALDPQGLRAQEIAHCAPGELSTWPDGRDGPSASAAWLFEYESAGAPIWLDSALVLRLLERAAGAWAPCGLPIQVRALDAAQRPDPAQARVRVLWDEAGARGGFGLADLGRRRLSLSPAAFALLRQRNPQHPADATLQLVLSHEMGHFLGLVAHSRRCVDVMSYYHDGRGNHCFARDAAVMKAYAEYRASLPTACDIQRCGALNGRR
ncbi:hypothetical protein G8A07_03450 [Roseateles sp. DAIF2]|uniref:hypothetical protein n=1 Tax=Roseateles sp. DAIF2 TaxID=2714952 RepID=UPI0018A336ED|nr:hypothetical protein [Roseateles sp. DAIF2]QPF72077.1 hypothetical protein G8A07_03450 [Roseateles sp. DAIF2]